MRAAVAIVITVALLAGCASIGRPGGSHYAKKNGLYVEHSKVSTFCLVPRLRGVIHRAERHFNAPVVVTSGYRNPIRNWRNGGARRSYHKRCMAADIFAPGVAKSDLIAYMMRQREVGGLGCDTGRKFIHIDVRPRPPGARGPVTFDGC